MGFSLAVCLSYTTSLALAEPTSERVLAKVIDSKSGRFRIDHRLYQPASPQEFSNGAIVETRWSVPSGTRPTLAADGRIELPDGAVLSAISVNPETGSTRYYEFGRYQDKECGNVKRRPVPDLKMGADGLPTPGSLSALYSFISANYGHGSPVSPTYYPDSDYSATNDFAEDFSRNHSCYGLFSNNCKSFARDAATAGKE